MSTSLPRLPSDATEDALSSLLTVMIEIKDTLQRSPRLSRRPASAGSG